MSAFVGLLVLATTGACGTGPHVAKRLAVAGAHQGGTLRVGDTAPGSVDPSNAYEPAGNYVIWQICEPLLQFDPLTAKRVPGIAKSWIVSGNGRQVTATLRTDVRFQGGGTLQADDVLRELSRVASLENASYSAKQLSDVAGYDFLHGDVDVKNDTEALTRLVGVQPIANDSFWIQVGDHRDASLVDVLGSLIASPAPRGAINRADFSSKPRCDGPYEMTAPWQPGQSKILLKRFSGYYAHNPVYPNGGVGYVDNIEFQIYPSLRAELPAFKAGHLDIAQVPDEELPQAAQLAATSGNKIVSGANGDVEYVGFPTTGSSVFAKPVVHQALSEALDRTGLSQAAYAGGSLPATGFIPPTVGEGYRPNACSAAPATANVAAAQAALAAAGVKLTGQTIKLFFPTVDKNAPLAQSIATQWTRAFGLHVTLVPMAWDAYLTQATGLQGFGGGAFLEGWGTPYPSADKYLAPLFSSNSVGTDNWSRYSGPTFDRILNYGARWQDDTPSRTIAYDYLARLVCRDMPMAPLVYRQWHYLVRTSALGSAIGSFMSAATGYPDLREIYFR